MLQCLDLPLLDAVVALDSALRSRSVGFAQVRAAVEKLRGRARARGLRAVGLCDPRSGSVLESVMRVRLVEAGITAFRTQVVVRDARGRRLLRADFCFDDAGLLLEVDGARWHDRPRDRGLDNDLAPAGWRVMRFNWSEVMHDPERVLDLVRAALAARPTGP